jgi:hypothetical protein
MCERAVSVGGTLAINAGPERGVEVCLRVPAVEEL